METWFIYSLVAALAIGGMQALYKVPSAKGHNKFIYSIYSFGISTILSLVFFFDFLSFDFATIVFGLLWGTGFAIGTALQMEILKKLDTNTAFPITSLSSHVFVVIIGLSFFGDVLSWPQMLGIILTFVIVGFYNQANKHITCTNGLFTIAAGIVLISTFCKFIQKYGSISSEVHNFIFWQLFFATVAAFLIFIAKSWRQNTQPAISKSLIVWSILLGSLNFIGTYAIVKALSTGPFSLVYTINSFYILIASVIAWQFFGEKLNRQKVVFVLLAIFILILIKIG